MYILLFCNCFVSGLLPLLSLMVAYYSPIQVALNFSNSVTVSIKMSKGMCGRHSVQSAFVDDAVPNNYYRSVLIYVFLVCPQR